jgi:hypothetical protein
MYAIEIQWILCLIEWNILEEFDLPLT